MSETSSSHALSRDLDLALRLADAADAQSLSRFDAADLDITVKADQSFVTDADLAVERAIRELLTTERPDDGIVGEEYGTDGGTARQWIIDPIDGTSNFLRGVPLWGTMIALAIEGRPTVGVVSMPALHRRWWGIVGEGASTRNGADVRSIRVSDITDLNRASISTQSIKQWDGAGQADKLIPLSRLVWRDRAYGDVFSYMMLAEGRLEMVAEFDVKEYDIAAAAAIVTAAGGKLTSFDGAETISAGSTLATNGLLHAEFLRVLHDDEASPTNLPHP